MKISKDKLKLIIIIIVAFIIGFVTAYIVEITKPNKIPQLYAKNEKGTCVEFIRGSYTWEKGIFKKQCIITDSIHPTKFEYKQENIMYVKPNEKIIISNNSNFENDYDFNIVDAKLYILMLGGKDIDLSENLENTQNEINLPDTQGIYALSITLNYAENKKVTYCIKIIFEDGYVPLENLPNEYSLDSAIKDKCYIITNSGEKHNVEKMNNFLIDLNVNRENTIRIIRYTIEGDMIITDVIYKDGVFKVRQDYTRDEFSVKEDRVIREKTFNKYKIEEKENYKYLVLTNVKNESIEIVIE